MKDNKPVVRYQENTCPLCNNENACANVDAKTVANVNRNEEAVETPNSNKVCWCMNPEIQFSEGLLAQVPADAKNKSCICQACALAYQAANKGE